MKKGLFILLIVSPVLLFYCDCFCFDRDYGTIKVKVTIDDENSSPFLTIFEGDSDNGDTIIAERVNSEVIKYKGMDPDVYYSAAITYTSGSRSITAVDGKYMSLRENEDCDCYRAENITLNLRMD